jgi:hypothetical protein
MYYDNKTHTVYTTDQQMHYSNNLLIHYTAPTCFDVYTSSSGSLLLCVLLSYIKMCIVCDMCQRVFAFNGCS